jgi:hypothetical protein
VLGRGRPVRPQMSREMRAALSEGAAATSSTVEPPAVFPFASVAGGDTARLPTNYANAGSTGRPRDLGTIDVSAVRACRFGDPGPWLADTGWSVRTWHLPLRQWAELSTTRRQGEGVVKVVFLCDLNGVVHLGARDNRLHRARHDCRAPVCNGVLRPIHPKRGVLWCLTSGFG